MNIYPYDRCSEERHCFFVPFPGATGVNDDDGLIEPTCPTGTNKMAGSTGNCGLLQIKPSASMLPMQLFSSTML